MATTNDHSDTTLSLTRRFDKTGLLRPMRIDRYEPGTILTYTLSALLDPIRVEARLRVERFVGGGFAGQVYLVTLLDYSEKGRSINGLQPSLRYAMKILVPPSRFSRLFRDTLYKIGFQAPFQLQVNPGAARAGALWQKFIRRGALVAMGDEGHVVDVHATFIDERVGSCGEISEWIDGRTWRLEVDERMDLLADWKKGNPVDETKLGSVEYRAKWQFMRRFVDLLHEMGAHEFARQYEWWTLKSQPNCLKRLNSGKSDSSGLVAVDFRAGLVLLPFLPMSPGDFKLIVQGLARGAFVQFDRGNLDQLRRYIIDHSKAFADMKDNYDELLRLDLSYRESQIDLSRHHYRLLTDRQLWRSILTSTVEAWKITSLVDEEAAKKLKVNLFLVFLLGILGNIPFIGNLLIRLTCHPAYRKHYSTILTDGAYLKRAIQAKASEMAIGWLRAGRVTDLVASSLPDRFAILMVHMILAILPAGLHRILSDKAYALERLAFYTVRPVRLYFNASLRTKWLGEMIADGLQKRLLTAEEASTIESQISEDYIQKYLKSLAVHVCTLPVTQAVSVSIAIIYVLLHPEMPKTQSWAVGLGIIALFQVIPLSPGSLVRGLYVTALVIRERSAKDYHIALGLSFFKYIGYLAFPIQMGYRYPALARFMAAHWATGAVHIVPVFGEQGALFEHFIFSLFYNWPLTIRRRMQARAVRRSEQEPRFWPVFPMGLYGIGLFSALDGLFIHYYKELPTFSETIPIFCIIPLVNGMLLSLGLGGYSLKSRISIGIIVSVVIAVVSSLCTYLLIPADLLSFGPTIIALLWRIFIVTFLSLLVLLVSEMYRGEEAIRP